MKKKGRITSLVAAAMLAIGLTAMPATAHEPPGEATCVGSATVTADDGGGIYAPGVGPEKSFGWSINDDTTCTVVTAEGAIDGTLQGEGRATGWCGRSVGEPVGTATLTTADGHSLTFNNVSWQSAGSVLVVSGETDDGETLTAVVEAFGGQDCFDGAGDGATDFDIVIEATVA